MTAQRMLGGAAPAAFLRSRWLGTEGAYALAMKVGRICNRRVSTISKNEPVLEAARRMRDEHVGDLVVLEDDGGRRVPVGIVTDRDIVVGLLAKDVDHLRQLDVKDVLTRAVTAVHQEDDVEDVILEMQRIGVRRMPVVDDAGELSGIFTVDDFLGLLSEDLASIVSLVANARRREMAERT